MSKLGQRLIGAAREAVGMVSQGRLKPKPKAKAGVCSRSPFDPPCGTPGRAAAGRTRQWIKADCDMICLRLVFARDLWPEIVFGRPKNSNIVPRARAVAPPRAMSKMVVSVSGLGEILQ